MTSKFPNIRYFSAVSIWTIQCNYKTYISSFLAERHLSKCDNFVKKKNGILTQIAFCKNVTLTEVLFLKYATLVCPWKDVTLKCLFGKCHAYSNAILQHIVAVYISEGKVHV